MNSFDPFLSRLGTIHDPRRAEGKLYQLPYILLFSILAIVTGANSYRGIRTFIKVQLKRLNKAFKIGWKRPPAHTAIRYILQGLNPTDVERVFREHAAHLNSSAAASEFEAAGGLIGEPGFGFPGDVRGVIVEDQLDRGVGRIGRVEKLEEFDEFAAAMAILDQRIKILTWR